MDTHEWCKLQRSKSKIDVCVRRDRGCKSGTERTSAQNSRARDHLQNPSDCVTSRVSVHTSTTKTSFLLLCINNLEFPQVTIISLCQENHRAFLALRSFSHLEQISLLLVTMVNASGQPAQVVARSQFLNYRLES
jgi:hypothetical protein